MSASRINARFAAKVFAALLVALPLASGTAQARPTWSIKDNSIHESRAAKIDIVGNVRTFGDFGAGIGGWYSMPLVPDGFIPALNDAFMLEGGGFVTYRSVDLAFTSCDYSYYTVSPLAGVRWDFFLSDDLTAFATMKTGYHIGFGGAYSGCGTTGSVGTPTTSRLAIEGGAGIYWNFSEGMALRAEMGPFGPTGGISIDL